MSYTKAGLLGITPSRHFKIFREGFPAIMRFNGKLYMEHYNLGEDDASFVEVTEADAMRWLEVKHPDIAAEDLPTLQTTAEAATTVTPSQENAQDSEELVESIRVRTRRRYWERRFDQGYHGHLAGNKEKWVNDQLEREGYL